VIQKSDPKIKLPAKEIEDQRELLEKSGWVRDFSSDLPAVIVGRTMLLAHRRCEQRTC
jgi:hypothetical protein